MEEFCSERILSGTLATWKTADEQLESSLFPHHHQKNLANKQKFLIVSLDELPHQTFRNILRRKIRFVK